MDKLNRLSWLASLFTLSCLIPAPGQAQIVGDGTLSTEVTTSDNRNFIITGNSQASGNLFHSFSQFSIPDGGSAFFNNDMGVVNIIGRVTGGSISDINGSISARGNANLFLINPNGIILGPKAQLNIGGSFIASTASRLNFADGSFFSATDTQTPPLLTVSTPNGLQLGKVAGSIVNRSSLTDTDGNPVGLQVQPNRTLALIGSDVILENGSLTAPTGRIDIGSVSSNSLVSLTPIAAGWKLGYENVQNFQDIRLSQGVVNVGTTPFLSNVGSGNIQLQGKQIDISASDLGGINDGTEIGGNLEIRGSESVKVGNSNLVNATIGRGAAGNIIIETKRLILSNASFVDALTYSAGQGGTIAINASESVELNGDGQLTQISSQAFSSGDAGKIEVNTNRLILKDGGQISTSTRSTGNAGTVNINATEFVAVSGQGQDETDKSGVFAQTKEPFTTGDGGSLNIETGRLVVQDGGSISVASLDGSTGQAGSLDITAVDSVEVSGKGSSLQASSVSPKPAGNLTITTDKLVVQDGAKVNVSSTGTGNAGKLMIAARTISLDNQGQLISTSEVGKGGGDITLQDVDSLMLRNNSSISTNARGEGNGGNITIATDLLTALGNSSITATTNEGTGGVIKIKTQGLFLSPDSIISADATSKLGIDGVVEIDRPESEPNDDTVSVPVEPVDLTELIATGCGASGSVAAKTSTSKFIITGRGGLPPTPTEALRSDLALADLGASVEQDSTARTTTATKQIAPQSTPIVEAQGWIISPKGQVVLTASAPDVTPEIPWLKSPSCHNS